MEQKKGLVFWTAPTDRPFLPPSSTVELTSSRKNSMHSFPLLSTTPTFFNENPFNFDPELKLYHTTYGT